MCVYRLLFLLILITYNTSIDEESVCLFKRIK